MGKTVRYVQCLNALAAAQPGGKDDLTLHQVLGCFANAWLFRLKRLTGLVRSDGDGAQLL